MRERLRGEPRRIAVFRALFLGDMIVSVPAFRALRRRFPSAEITYIGLPWAAEFARHFPAYIDQFAEFPGYPGINEVAVDPQRTADFLAEQRAQGYELAIQMHGSGVTSNPFVIELGAMVTAGFCQGTPAVGLTLAAPYPIEKHEILRNLDLVRLLGGRSLDPRLEFPVLPADRQEVEALVAKARGHGRPVIGLHPGAKLPSRRWPAEYFARVGDELSRRLDARIVLTGSKSELALVREVVARMRSRPVIAAGRTSLGGLAALVDEMDLVISNDTGPGHLAQAVGTRSIVIFGPTEYHRWAPLDQARHRALCVPVECSPCDYGACPIDHRCMRGVTPDMVMAVAGDLLRMGVAA